VIMTVLVWIFYGPIVAIIVDSVG